jgi:hypothetical protein
MKTKSTLKGAFHVHSKYSKDGELSLEELAQKAKSLGYDFLVLTDHIEDMDELMMNELIAECRRVTEAYALEMIPGVEIRLKNKAHILMVGIGAALNPACCHDIELLRKTAKDNQALIGLAHLSHEPNLSLSELSKFDFIEGWNHRYDKRFPPFRSLRTAEALSKSCFVGGLDLHSVDDLGFIWLETEARSIMDGIRSRNVTTKNSIIEIDKEWHLKKGRTIYLAFFWTSFCLNYFATLTSKPFSLAERKPPRILRKIAKTILG